MWLHKWSEQNVAEFFCYKMDSYISIFAWLYYILATRKEESFQKYSKLPSEIFQLLNIQELHFSQETLLASVKYNFTGFTWPPWQGISVHTISPVTQWRVPMFRGSQCLFNMFFPSQRLPILWSSYHMATSMEQNFMSDLQYDSLPLSHIVTSEGTWGQYCWVSSLCIW